MAVEDTLSGSLTDVNTYIKSIGMIPLFNLLTHILIHHAHRFALVIGKVEI